MAKFIQRCSTVCEVVKFVGKLNQLLRKEENWMFETGLIESPQKHQETSGFQGVQIFLVKKVFYVPRFPYCYNIQTLNPVHFFRIREKTEQKVNDF